MEIPSDEIDEIDAKVATFSFDANDEIDETDHPARRCCGGGLWVVRCGRVGGQR